MREAVLPSTYLQEDAEDLIKGKYRAKRWQLVLIVSVSTALLFVIAGLIVSGLAYFGLVEHAKIVSRIGTIMIVVSAPLFVLSAHSLDEIRFEEKRKKRLMWSKDFK